MKNGKHDDGDRFREKDWFEYIHFFRGRAHSMYDGIENSRENIFFFFKKEHFINQRNISIYIYIYITPNPAIYAYGKCPIHFNITPQTQDTFQ